MANFNFYSLVFFNVALLFTTIIFSHVESTNDDVISTICPKTTNPKFCSNFLKSVGSTDLKSIANYSLNLARAKADVSLTLAKSLAAAPTAANKEQYLSCVENYDEAVGDIENAHKYLTSGDFNGVNIATSGVMTVVENCKESFKQQPPTEMLTLLSNDKNLNDICSIILVISNLLPKPM